MLFQKMSSLLDFSVMLRVFSAVQFFWENGENVFFPYFESSNFKSSCVRFQYWYDLLSKCLTLLGCQLWCPPLPSVLHFPLCYYTGETSQANFLWSTFFRLVPTNIWCKYPKITADAGLQNFWIVSDLLTWTFLFQMQLNEKTIKL